MFMEYNICALKKKEKKRENGCFDIDLWNFD